MARPMSSEFVDPILNVESVGPFKRYPVVVNGWSVPHLEAVQYPDQVWVTLDHRLLLEINEQTTPGQIIHFVADAIAVAKGYACHPTKDGWADEDRTNPPTNPRWPWMHMSPFAITGLEDK